jgi:hypothetical protein
MTIEVVVRRRGWPVWITETIIDGLFCPDHIVELMYLSVCREIGLCDNCEVAYKGHVGLRIGDHTEKLLCPVLFHDIFKPSWEVKELA